MNKAVRWLAVLGLLHFCFAGAVMKLGLFTPNTRGQLFLSGFVSLGAAIVISMSYIGVCRKPLFLGQYMILHTQRPYLYWTIIGLGIAFGSWLMLQVIRYAVGT